MRSLACAGRRIFDSSTYQQPSATVSGGQQPLAAGCAGRAATMRGSRSECGGHRGNAGRNHRRRFGRCARATHRTCRRAAFRAAPTYPFHKRNVSRSHRDDGCEPARIRVSPGKSASARGHDWWTRRANVTPRERTRFRNDCQRPRTTAAPGSTDISRSCGMAARPPLDGSPHDDAGTATVACAGAVTPVKRSGACRHDTCRRARPPHPHDRSGLNIAHLFPERTGATARRIDLYRPGERGST